MSGASQAASVIGTDLRCHNCEMVADLCLSMRDDCCTRCTHYPEPDAEDYDEVAVERAIKGDLSVPLNRQEHDLAWRGLEAQGLSAADIADTLGISAREVTRWRAGTAHPISRPGGTMTTTPISAAPSAIDAMLQRARQSESAKVRTAASRVDGALDRLRAALTDDEGKQEARRRVARLERELREAKAALRGKPTTVTTAAPRQRATGERADCRKCGKQCANSAGRASHERNCTAA